MKKPATIVIATRNAHKVVEIAQILGPGFHCVSLKQIPGAPEIVEDASSFAGNAAKKAAGIARWLSAVQTRHDRSGASPGPGADANAVSSLGECFVLADDSGLEVDALGGAPGVHSARFAALDQGQAVGNSNTPDAANNEKLLRLLKDIPPHGRTARFRCVLALCPCRPAPAQTSSPACYADEFELLLETFEGVCEGVISLAPTGTGGFGYDPLFIYV
jgi:XTP/dITP diphosphohydrolase